MRSPASRRGNFQCRRQHRRRVAKLTIEANGPTAAEIAASSALRGGSPGGPGMIVVGGPNPDNETYTVELKPGPGLWASVGIEVDSDFSLPGANVSRGSDRFIVTEVDARYSADGREPLKPAPFVLAYSATTPTTGYPALAAIDGDSKTGWGFFGGAGKPFLILRFAEPVKNRARFDAGDPLASGFQVSPGHAGAIPYRIIERHASVAQSSDSAQSTALTSAERRCAAAKRAARNCASGPPLPAPLRQALELAEDKRTPEQIGVIRDYFEYSSADLFAARLAIAKLEMTLSFLQAAVAQVMVTESMEPRETRLLPRGDWMSDAGALLQPAIPEFLGKLDTGGRRATRLDLANWLVSPNNPLTARVFVNRLVAPVLRHRPFASAGRCRLAGRMALASRIAGLAGIRVHESDCRGRRSASRGTFDT